MIDRNKVIQMVVILAAVIVVFSSLSKILGGNSTTLLDFASENPDLAYPDTEEETEEGGEESAVDEAESSAVISQEEEKETENLQNEANKVNVTALTGALLNGNLMEEVRITYAENFYYEPLSDSLKRYITGVSYPNNLENPEVSYDELCYVYVWYYDFDGNPSEGELICNEVIAQDLVEIFYELYRQEYRIDKIRLIDEYDGDDLASMEDNNTSCFNYRLVEGSTSLSKHAYGLAIDVNPYYNPYVTYGQDGEEIISPVSASAYADRRVGFPYKIDEDDLCYKLFIQHGFIWGGNWNSVKDYQHFQKSVD